MERMWIVTLISVLVTALVVGPAVYFLAPRPEVEVAPKPVKMGAIFPLTGVTSYMGIREAAAAQMAADEINDLGGVLGGRPLQLIIEDDESTPSSGVEAVHKLIDIDQVSIVIGAHTSSVTIPTATYSNEQGIPQIGVASTSPDIRYIGPYFWCTVAEDKLMGRALVEYAYEDGNGSLGNVGMYVMNDPYGIGVENVAIGVVQELGGQVVTTVEYEVGKSDYRLELDRLFAEPLDTVIVIAWGSDALITFKQMNELGYYEAVKGRIYCPYVMDVYLFLQEDYPELIEGLKGLDIGGYDTPKGIKFQEKFGQLHPDLMPVDYSTFNAYDAVWIGALAINLANSDDPAKINAALPLAFEMYYGTASPDMRVDEDGMQISQIFLKRVFIAGEVVTVGSLVSSTE